MFGIHIGRVCGEKTGVGYPHGTIFLFKRKRRPARGDIVLVRHPELGRIVRKVSVVGRRGGVHLAGMSRLDEAGKGNSRVDPDDVLGVKWIKLA